MVFKSRKSAVAYLTENRLRKEVVENRHHGYVDVNNKFDARFPGRH